MLCWRTQIEIFFNHMQLSLDQLFRLTLSDSPDRLVTFSIGVVWSLVSFMALASPVGLCWCIMSADITSFIRELSWVVFILGPGPTTAFNWGLIEKIGKWIIVRALNYCPTFKRTTPHSLHWQRPSAQSLTTFDTLEYTAQLFQFFCSLENSLLRRGKII